MSEAYCCEGKRGVTFGLLKDGELLIQIQHPSGEYGTVRKSGWSIERWKGQLGAKPCDLAQLPADLQAMA